MTDLPQKIPSFLETCKERVETIATSWRAPKGTYDLCGDDYIRLKYITNIIEEQFILNNGKPLETPVFEFTSVLMGKYGEQADTKLVYNIEDNGGEPLTLRYDLTLPFVRYIKENNIEKMRRYAIGKVYRRDQPNIHNGRFREFYQADFDILGEDNESMIAECTLLRMASNVLNRLGLRYTILVNDVENLKNSLLEIVKVPTEKWRALCPIIDKLDKTEFETLIPQFRDVYPDIDIELLKSTLAVSNPCLDKSKLQWEKLCKYAKIFKFDSNLKYSSSLARGLDYYSGFIWEIKIEGYDSTVIAGGRYDSLMNKSLVGISFGVSRMLSMVKQTIPLDTSWDDSIFVTSIGTISVLDRMKVVVWANTKYPTQKVVYSCAEKDKKLIKVLNDCISSQIRYVLIIAENEWQQKQVILKDLMENSQTLVTVNIPLE